MDKIYQIILIDKTTNKVLEKIEDHDGNLESLKERLAELQEGYCEDEVPVVLETKRTSNGLLYHIIIAESDSDYSYASVLGLVK